MKTIEWEQIGVIREEEKIILVYRNQEGDIRVQEEGGELKPPSEEVREKVSDLVFPVNAKRKKKIPLTDP